MNKEKLIKNSLITLSILSVILFILILIPNVIMHSTNRVQLSAKINVDVLGMMLTGTYYEEANKPYPKNPEEIKKGCTKIWLLERNEKPI